MPLSCGVRADYLLRPIIAVLIFAATYLIMAVGRLPGWQLDRAGAALLGASLMVGFGVLDLQEAYAAIDMRCSA